MSNQKVVYCLDCKVYIRRLYPHYNEKKKRYHRLVTRDGYKK